MTSQQPDELLSRGRNAELERALIEEYLGRLGYTIAALNELPEAQARELMRAASLYASMRLSEVETRSHFVEEIHGGSRPI